nr:hypothetical protein [Rhodoferax sp.]
MHSSPYLAQSVATGYRFRLGLAQGLPANFVGYRRHLGSRVLEVDAGPVDTGDLLEMP